MLKTTTNRNEWYGSGEIDEGTYKTVGRYERCDHLTFSSIARP